MMMRNMMKRNMMKRFGKNFICLSGLLVSVSVFAGCSGGEKAVIPVRFQGQENPFRITSLDEQWNMHTIRLKPSMEASSEEGRGPMGGLFPLMASATIIDSSLARQGIEEFSILARLSDTAKAGYLKRYSSANRLDNGLFVWLELRTPYSEDLLDMDKWSIFLEDEKGSRFDPLEVRGYKLPERQLKPQISRSSEPGMGKYWEVTSKILQLYFPDKKFDGSPMITKNGRLRLVLFNWSNNARYAGEWEMAKFR